MSNTNISDYINQLKITAEEPDEGIFPSPDNYYFLNKIRKYFMSIQNDESVTFKQSDYF